MTFSEPSGRFLPVFITVLACREYQLYPFPEFMILYFNIPWTRHLSGLLMKRRNPCFSFNG
jgi:hypothetical protein